MVDQALPRVMLSLLDSRDPNFPEQSALWAAQLRGDIVELIANAKESLAGSRELMVKIDEILAMR